MTRIVRFREPLTTLACLPSLQSIALIVDSFLFSGDMQSTGICVYSCDTILWRVSGWWGCFCLIEWCMSIHEGIAHSNSHVVSRERDWHHFMDGMERHRFTFDWYILYAGFLHLYNSDVPYILYTGACWSETSPTYTCCHFPPANMVHAGPGHCRESHGRSEVAEGDCIAPTVLIEGWLVSGPGGSSALLPCWIGVDFSQGQVNILVFFRSLTSMASPDDQWLG